MITTHFAAAAKGTTGGASGAFSGALSGDFVTTTTCSVTAGAGAGVGAGATGEPDVGDGGAALYSMVWTTGGGEVGATGSG